MQAKRISQLPSRRFFAVKMAKNLLIALALIAIALYVGMVGYHHFEHMNWIDAFANASMILSGMGPFGPLTTTGGKIFAGLYALFSGLTFILIMATVLAPIVHRMFHDWHIKLYDNNDSKDDK